jgi:hypothetical protein
MPRIVYLSWPAREISGGIKAAFQHVELLNEAGLEAIIASDDGAAPAWFETKAPVFGLRDVRTDDVLVFPENSQHLFQTFASWSNPKLVFCQSPLLACQGMGTLSSCADAGISHIMCPSHTVLHYCRRRFPGVRLAYTPFYVDHSRFAYAAAKTLQIACVPRKRPNEFRAIVDLFRAGYPQHRSLNWVYLQQASEAQVAQVMGRSAVFLSLARLEAHAMTTLEAMASGCIVAGFTGVAGATDAATARNGFWAAEDDLSGCVDQLARAVQLAMDRDIAFDAMVEEGRRTAHEYRREEAARRLLEFWREALPAGG